MAPRQNTATKEVATQPDTRPGKITQPLTSAKEWKDWIAKAEKQIRAAFPKAVKFERVLSCIQSQMLANPRLSQCTPLSILGSIIQSAQLGLDLDRNLGEAYMVPYQNSKKVEGQWTKQYEAQLQIGYQGLMKLCRNSGTVGDIRAVAVYENDYFEYDEGTAMTVKHTRWEMLVKQKRTEAKDRGELFAIYTVAQTKDMQDQSVKVMFISEIERIRQRSRAKDDGPWVTDYEAMCKKTCIRQHTKMLPKSVELGKAVALDELHDANLPQGLDLIPFLKADPEAAEELKAIQEEGQKQAERVQEQDVAPIDMTAALLAKVQTHADALIAKHGDCEAFDDIVTKLQRETKQKSGNPQEWDEAGLTALLAALEKANG